MKSNPIGYFFVCAVRRVRSCLCRPSFMMLRVDPGEKVQKEHDEEQEYEGMNYDHVFPRCGCGIDVSETDCRGGHEAEIDEVEPGMSLSLQQVQSAVNNGKIEGNLDVVKEQEKDGPLG